MSNRTPVIKSIQDIMRQDSGVDGDAQRISQSPGCCSLKVFDALEEELNSPAMTTKPHCRAPALAPLGGRMPSGMTGDALLDFVDKQLFPASAGPSADPQRNLRG